MRCSSSGIWGAVCPTAPVHAPSSFPVRLKKSPSFCTLRQCTPHCHAPSAVCKHRVCTRREEEEVSHVCTVKMTFVPSSMRWLLSFLLTQLLSCRSIKPFQVRPTAVLDTVPTLIQSPAKRNITTLFCSSPTVALCWNSARMFWWPMAALKMPSTKSPM